MKFLKILLVNFIILIALFILADFITFNIICSADSAHKISISKYLKSLKEINLDYIYNKYKKGKRFPDVISDENFTKKSILIMGGSFAYGFLLSKNEGPSQKFADLSGRNIYNRAIPSLGIQHMLYFLEEYNIEKEIKNLEYIILIIDEHHFKILNRNYIQLFEFIPDIKYKVINNELVREKIKKDFWGKFTIYRFLKNKQAENYFQENGFQNNFNLMKLYFFNIKKIINEKFPNAKIVILKYEQENDNRFYTSKRWSELGKEGFIILGSYELTNEHLYKEKYKLEKDHHPNKEAWDLLVPKIVEKLELE